METVLITGATGFLGRHCLAALAERAGSIHILGRTKPESKCGIATFHAVDLLQPPDLEPLLREIRPTHLLHLAWIAIPGIYWTSLENLDWVAASLRLLRAFVASGGQRAVIAGTCAEYDWSAAEVCDEATTPLRPATLYGVCKNALREVAQAFAATTNLSLAWARLFFLHGPHEPPNRLAPSVIRSLLDAKPAACGSGTARRDFLYVEDVADALITLLASDVQNAVNIGSGEAVSIREVVEQIGVLLGRPELIRFGARPDPAGEPPLLTANVRRLREQLSWKPRRTLQEGLAETIRWWREQTL